MKIYCLLLACWCVWGCARQPEKRHSLLHFACDSIQAQGSCTVYTKPMPYHIAIPYEILKPKMSGLIYVSLEGQSILENSKILPYSIVLKMPNMRPTEKNRRIYSVYFYLEKGRKKYSSKVSLRKTVECYQPTRQNIPFHFTIENLDLDKQLFSCSFDMIVCPDDGQGTPIRVKGMLENAYINFE